MSFPTMLLKRFLVEISHFLGHQDVTSLNIDFLNLFLLKLYTSRGRALTWLYDFSLYILELDDPLE